MSAVRATVSESGRVELPPEHRKQLGLEHGGDVVVWVEEGEIRIRSLQDVVARVQEEVRRFGDESLSVDDFLATRLRDTGE